MGLVVAAISLTIAAFGPACGLRVDVSDLYEGKELQVGLAVIATLAASFLTGSWLARSPATAVADRSAS